MRYTNGWWLLALTLTMPGCDGGGLTDRPDTAPSSDHDAGVQDVGGFGGGEGEGEGEGEDEGAGGFGGAGAEGEDEGEGYSAADAGVGGEGEALPPQPWQREGDAEAFATVDVGDGETLLLESMRISVQIDGLRARTLVDHVFHNPYGQALEGTFRYPLPAGASVSFYSMFMGGEQQAPEFLGDDEALEMLDPEARAALDPKDWADGADPAVWGEQRVGRIAPAAQAREIFEDITRRPIDPALVEEVAPNTFEARVFPIPAHGYNRVMVAYEETLPRVGDALAYRFVVPPGERGRVELNLVAAGAFEQVGSLQAAPVLGDLYQAQIDPPRAAGDLTLLMPIDPAAADISVGRDPVGERQHVVARIHAPELAAEGSARPRAVFLLDTSYSADPDRFNVDVALVAAILEGNPAIESFAIITFDLGARPLTDGLVPNDAASRQAALAALDGILLEGATDLGAGLRAVEPLGGPQTDVFLMTDGGLNWGPGTAEELAAAFRTGPAGESRVFAYRTGLGAENEALFAALTRNGATFNCLSDDAVPACAAAHTRPGLVITDVALVGTGDDPAAVDELVIAGRQATLFTGARLTLAARIITPGDAEIRITGQPAGGEGPAQTLTWPVSLRGEGELAPRAWAEIVVAQLLESRDADLERVAVALSQRFSIISRATSLLLLERDEDYPRFGVEEARLALGDRTLVQLIADGVALLAERLGLLDSVLEQLDRTVDQHRTPAEISAGIRAAAAPGGLELPPSLLAAPLVYAADVPARYLGDRSHRPSVIGAFEDEADRRAELGQIAAAARALSSVVENSPADHEALRLVGYALDGWGEEAAAAALFLEVLRRRPYEPQSYRDLARALADTRPALSALLFEAALAGDWDRRFLGLRTIVEEDYALLIAARIRLAPEAPLTAWLVARREVLGLDGASADLRVTITWNTDNTDIDLWVTDPAGEKCYYANRQNALGGELLDDVTEGFGPERFEDRVADPGVYTVEAHYYANNGNRLKAETRVQYAITIHGGTPDERIIEGEATLDEPGDVALLQRVEF